MDLQELLTEVGEEKAAIFNAALEAAKQAEAKKGIEASRKKGAENTKLIAEIAKLKDAVKEVIGVDDLGDDPVETIKAALKTVKPVNGSGSFDELKSSLEASFKKQLAERDRTWQDKFDQEKREKESVEKKFRDNRISSKLSEAMNGKFKGHDIQIENWILKGKVKLDENDQVFFIGQDETDLIDQKKWLENFSKERSDLVISQQLPGGGSAGNRVDIGNTKQISMDQFTKLSIDDQNAFKKAGGNIVDQP